MLALPWRLFVRRLSHAPYPIDTLNAQTSLATVLHLITTKQQHRAEQLFPDLVASIPPTSRADTFVRLADKLLESPRENLPLIVRLASAYTALGYEKAVNERLLPTIVQSGPAHVKQFEHQVEQAATPPLSGGIFEDETDEYHSHRLPKSSKDHAAIQSTGALARLVKSGSYADAYVFYQELVELGVDIPRSHIYQAAVNAVLEDTSLDEETKIKRFTDWFSLLPLAHETKYRSNFPQTRRLILQSFHVSLPRLVRFSLLAAGKGYAKAINTHTIPQIAARTNISVLRNFLKEFISAYSRYAHTYEPHSAEFRVRWMFTAIVGLSIRELAHASRMEDAASLLPDPKNPRFKLTSYTYNVFLFRLKRHNAIAPPYNRLSKERHDQLVKLITELRDGPSSSVPVPSSGYEVLRAIVKEHEIIGTAHLGTYIDFGRDLVATLRYLKKNITSRDNPPHPFVLVNFMSLYLATGRTRALKMLLDKALRTSYFSTTVFVFAEMLFYRRLKQYDLVIQTFIDHFYINGVPREEISRKMIYMQSVHKHWDPSSGTPAPLKRFYPFDAGRTLPRGKLWPGRRHCDLVWDALANTASKTEDLEKLYHKLLKYVADGRESEEVSMPTLWRAAAGAAAFTPFIQRMMFDKGPKFGIGMLRDMLQLGIKPTVYHYTELAGYYARRDDIRRVFVILNNMEKKEKQPFGSETYEQPPKGVSTPIKKYELPEPTLVTYVCVLRGFLIARNLEAAKEIKRRLKRSFPVDEGDIRQLDLALKDLEDFERDGENWIYPHPEDLVQGV